jgi:hypothetical protein
MAMLLLFVARHPGTLPVQTVMPNLYDVPLVLGFGVVSVVILRRLPRHPIGWLFGLMAVAVAYNTFAGGYSAWDFPATEWVLWVWNVLTGPTFFGMAMALLLFPTGRPGSPRWRWLAWLLWIYVAAEVLVACVSPWPNRVPFVDIEVQAYLGWPHRNPLAWEGQGWLPDAFASASPVGVALILASLLSLLPRWRRATGDERQQIKWLGLAALLLTLEFVGGVSQFATGGPPDDPANQMLGQAVFTLIVAGIPLTIGLGIARYRLYDIDILVSKTIAFGGLVGFIGLAYVVGVVVVGQLVGSTGSSTLPALTATAVVATVFQPLRTWLRSRADRWVFGERAAPYELMTRFGQDLGQTLDSTQILARIAATAAQAVRARSARVTATLPNGEVLTACWPATVSPRSFDIVIPVYHEGATIAEISVVGAGARPLTAHCSGRSPPSQPPPCATSACSPSSSPCMTPSNARTTRSPLRGAVWSPPPECNANSWSRSSLNNWGPTWPSCARHCLRFWPMSATDRTPWTPSVNAWWLTPPASLTRCGHSRGGCSHRFWPTTGWPPHSAPSCAGSTRTSDSRWSSPSSGAASRPTSRPRCTCAARPPSTRPPLTAAPARPRCSCRTTTAT